MAVMTRSLRLLLALLFFLSLASCSGSNESESTPTPTLPAATATPEPSPTPTDTETPTPRPQIIIAPSVTPTPYPTPAVMSAAVQITTPSPMSKVVSPLTVRGFVIPGYNNRIRVELFGEDGRLLVREVMTLYTSAVWGYVSVDLHYEISAAAELGRLSISTEDEFGRLVAVNSVHILLMQEGELLPNPMASLDERCLIAWPYPGIDIYGGVLLVDGEYRPFNSQPLVIELIDENGSALATRLVDVAPTATDDYVDFTTDMPYQIAGPMRVRLTIRQADERIPGTIYLYSQEVVLYP